MFALERIWGKAASWWKNMGAIAPEMNAVCTDIYSRGEGG